MNALLCSTILVAGLFTFATESTLDISRSQNGSLDLPSKKTLVVNNATQNFVRKVFQRYSSENKSREISVNDFYGLLATLRIGDIYNVTSRNAGTASSDKHKQENEKKTTSTRDLSKQTKSSDGAAHRQKYHKNCITKEKLLQLHQISKETEIRMDDFIRICPSLVYEVQNGACLHIEPKVNVNLEKEAMTLEAWMYGVLAITIISLSSLFAITLIPCLGKAIYNKVMSFLVALAIGTLAGDAFLHLIPHAFLKDIHLEKEEGHVKPVWKGLVIMGGIYLFLMLEKLMKLRVENQERKEKIQQKNHHQEHTAHGDEVEPIVSHKHCVHTHSDTDSRDTGLYSPNSANETELLSDISQSDGMGYGDSKNDKWKMPVYSKDASGGSDSSYSESDLRVIINQQFECEGSCHNVKQLSVKRCDSTTDSEHKDTEEHHHHHHHHGNKDITTSTPIATVAWMVIVGDGFHNFSDGLAVGAAFSSSVTNGLTTSIAVLCHELPHELGDFAVLIKSGMSFKQAIVYNVASALVSYVGLIVGLALGNLDTSHVWVLAITSGLFLYISFIGMLPELSSYQTKGGGFSTFLWQNAGILTGVIIMLVIALLEDH